jgi:hypothetical protein
VETRAIFFDPQDGSDIFLQNVPLTFNGLNGVISQMIELFMYIFCLISCKIWRYLGNEFQERAFYVSTRYDSIAFLAVVYVQYHPCLVLGRSLIIFMKQNSSFIKSKNSLPFILLKVDIFPTICNCRLPKVSIVSLHHDTISHIFLIQRGHAVA